MFVLCFIQNVHLYSLVSVFWGGREGYNSLLNTDLKAELSHMANFFKMVIGKLTYTYLYVYLACT